MEPPEPPFEYGDAPGSEKLLMARLHSMGIFDPVALIEYAITKGWIRRYAPRNHWSVEIGDGVLTVTNPPANI